MNYTPGPGDQATWGPCFGHPNDPRTEELTLDWVADKVYEDLLHGNDAMLPTSRGTISGITTVFGLLSSLHMHEVDNLAEALSAAGRGDGVAAMQALKELAETVAERYTDEHGVEWI